MDTTQQAARAKAKGQQRLWYGTPLGDIFQGLFDDLGLNQARLAPVLGVSAPMLSQLASGQRANSHNAAFVPRLTMLRELARQKREGTVEEGEVAARLEMISQHRSEVFLPAPREKAPKPAGPTVLRAVREIQDALRATAHAADLLDAAEALAKTHPELAEFLWVYGAGRTAQAVEHYQTLHRD
ncbi:DNA-binding protein [Streptomyces sp. N35]|uniref:DNA-binding protein n=1 Tax=Streptomyces sp. N35 TaxID=2795730 RepID=UPI0018F74663|nr:DNA-binding protein [Streptomyces sp. N35]